MTITLKQAFTIWANIQDNIVLAAKSRQAVQRVLMKKYNDIDMEQITPVFAERIFRQSSEPQKLKTMAASILVYLLQWGFEKGYCQRPTFDYTIASTEQKKDEPKEKRMPATKTLAEISGKTYYDEHRKDSEKPNDDADPLAGIDFPDEDKPKNDKSMEQEKKPRGKAPKPVAQLDPETLKVVKVWPSRCEAERQTGACNIDRCIAKHRMSAGYYWCTPDEADTFKPSPLSGNHPTKHNKKETSSASDIVTKNDQFKDDMKKIMPDDIPASVAAASEWTPKFKVGDHVWAKQPKEQAGRTGYVKAVDTYKMEYTVVFGKEVWIIPERENDLELVNEPVMAEYITERSTAALTDYTDEELYHELERRGWEGELSRRQIVTLGTKK